MAGEYCLPVWDDLCYSYNSNDAASEVIQNCRFDSGMMGVDVSRSSSYDIPLSVSFAKSFRQMCHHSVTSSMPCVTPDKYSRYFLKNLNYTKSEKKRIETIKKELTYKKNRRQWKEHIPLIDLLLSDPACVSEDELPKALKRYKKIVMKTPNKEYYWKHHKGALTTVKINRNHFALFSSGENFNKLTKISLNGNWNEKSNVKNLETKIIKSFDSDDGPILQVTTAYAQDTVFGALRQRKKCYLYKLEHNCKLKCLDTLTTDNTFNPIIDVAPSPYIPGEFVYLNYEGEIKTKNLEADNSIDIDKISLNQPKPLINVHYGPHPRSIILASSTHTKLLDFRASCNRSLPLLTLPNVNLPIGDSICSTKRFPGNDNLIVITTSSSVLILDQRHPDNYLLKWTHLLKHSPEMISIEPLVDGREVLILTASTKSQDVAMIHVEKNLSSVYSRCPTIHLSRPQDLLNFLPQGENDPVASLVTSSLIGIGLFSELFSLTGTVLQLTSSGTVFAQNVSVGAEKGSTSEWRVGPGMRNTDLRCSETLKNWAVKNGGKCTQKMKSKKLKKPKNEVNAGFLSEHLNVFSHDKVESSNRFDNFMKISNLFENSYEKCENEFGLEEVDVDDYDDKMSRKIVSVWSDDYDNEEST